MCLVLIAAKPHRTLKTKERDIRHERKSKKKYLQKMEAFTEIYNELIASYEYRLEESEENVKRVAEETDTTAWEYIYHTREANKAKAKADAYLAVAEEVLVLMNNTKIGKSN